MNPAIHGSALGTLSPTPPGPEDWFPNIKREDVEAALEFASRLSDYQASAYEAVA